MQVKPDFLDRLGQLVDAIGSGDFAPRLAATLRVLAPYSFTVVFGYRGQARPLDLFDDFPADKRGIFVTDYQDGPYLLDPFFLAATAPVRPGLYRIRDLAPDRFYQGEYFRNYYVRTGLAEEIGYFTDVGGGATVVVSMMRSDRPFTGREFRLLDNVRAPLQAAIRRHWSGLAGTFARPDGAGDSAIDGRIAQSLAAFGQGTLTARERQVAEYTLKGHSAEAVGRVLGISAGTVRIHRRNIYAKLRISSQGELFSRFMATLDRGPAATAGQDGPALPYSRNARST